MGKAIDIGRLNKRLEFQYMSTSTDELNQTKQVYTTFKTVWGSLYPTRGGEYYEAKKIRPELTYKAYTRYFKGLKPDMIIMWENRQFNIESVIDVDEEHRMYEIMCVEYVEAD